MCVAHEIKKKAPRDRWKAVRSPIFSTLLFLVIGFVLLAGGHSGCWFVLAFSLVGFALIVAEFLDKRDYEEIVEERGDELPPLGYDD